jgi:type IV pilus assembly protein PilQ
MNANDTIFGSRFPGRIASVYALCAVLASPALGQSSGNTANSEDGQDVKVTDYGTVDISVQDTDLDTVLQMLAIESKKNIISGKAVSATVTATLYDVTLNEALRAILEPNGYTFYEEGNFIYVVSKEEMDEMVKRQRKTESRIYELEYLSADDANEFIVPLLSESGKASARGDVQPGIKPDVSDAGADTYAYNARLVVNDYPENLDAIATLLTNVDTPPLQVLVEATILQTALDETNAFGVDLSVIGSVNFTDLTDPLAAVNNLIGGNDPRSGFQPEDNKAIAGSTNIGNVSGAGGLKIGFISDDISVFLRVLDEVTDFTTLARPKVMALNRQRAEVLVGARVGYLSTTSTETTTTQSVQFLDTGIQLVFRPFISKDGAIRMELKPSVSEASLRAVTDATGAIVTIPDELTNQVTTNVRIQDGETLVLGGLYKDATRTTRRQVPLLGDIPILGAAFRGQDDRVERSEVIFLITPTIVHDEMLWAIGAEHLASVDSMRVGARAGLLPFSQAKVTANYNQKAWDAYHNGDSDLAEHYINKSLGVFPNQREMIRLREMVTGDKAKAHETSLMERAFRKEMGPMVTPPPPPSEPAANAADSDSMGSAWSSSSDSGFETQSEDETAAAPESDSFDSNVEQDRTTSVDPETNSVPESSSSSSSTFQGEQYYQQVLHDLFLALGMTDMASSYAYADGQSGAEFPFTTFDEVEFANVSEPQEQVR